MKINKLIKSNLKINHNINKLERNSKKVQKNDVFYAVKGSLYDGNTYILDAIKNGAKTIISEYEAEQVIKDMQVNYLVVEDIRKTFANHLKIFYKNISSNMQLIGITGTNGKTTVSTLVYKYFLEINKKATLIGTSGIYINKEYFETNNTTPDILEIYEILSKSKKKKINTVIMEVSSHAVKMMRIYGLEFKIALITNFTLDHLDYHNTVEDYRYTKGLFLSYIEENNIVIINKDMNDFRFFYYMAKAKVYTFGQGQSDYRLIDYNLKIDGSSFLVNLNNKVYKVNTKLLGLFNIYNLISFIAIIHQLGLFNTSALNFMNSKINILGRMEVIKYKDRYFIIDFAHTPDGVENVLKFLNIVKENNLYVVIGCGGDRDKSKRKLIGDITSRLSSYVYYTNDNPRSEDPPKIIDNILEGVKTNNYAIILDRKMAIEEAYKRSLRNDIIAILGKGNEQYQIIMDEKIKLNDKEIVQNLI